MEEHLLDLAVGYCSDRNCKIRHKASTGHLPDHKLEFVHLEHTMPSRDGPTCTAPQMHVQCFEKYEESVMKRLKSNTLKDSEKRKAIWDQSRTGKYDMIQSLCVCKCGGRFIPIISGARNQVSTTCVEISPTTEKKKNRGKTKNVHVPAIRFDVDSDGDGEVDEDALQYVYKRIETCDLNDAEEESAHLEEHSLHDTTKFPELPFSGGLPSTIRQHQSFVRKPVPSITVKETNEFVCLSVDDTRSNEWTGWLIGRDGNRLKRVDAKFNTTTRINRSSDIVRIIICKATSEQRMQMAEYLQKEIVKVLTR